MQVEILEQFLGKDLFLEVNILENVKDLDKLRNEQSWEKIPSQGK